MSAASFGDEIRASREEVRTSREMRKSSKVFMARWSDFGSDSGERERGVLESFASSASIRGRRPLWDARRSYYANYSLVREIKEKAI